MRHDQDHNRLTDLWLPEWRCLPSHVAVADNASLKPAIESVPERLEPAAVGKSLAFRFGIDLFNTGFFWEAHEVWEPVWMALPPNSRERIALKALIQAANACLKLRYGARPAFGRLADEIGLLVRDVTVGQPCVAGVNLRDWHEEFTGFAGPVLDGRSFEFGFTPESISGFPYLRIEDERPR